MADAWPAILLPSSVEFHLLVPSASGGPSQTGGEQVVASNAGSWHATLTFAVRRQIGANPRARILAARAMQARLQGRANTVLIGPFDSSNAPSALAGGAQGLIGPTPHSDGAFFSDGSGYVQFATPVEAAASAEEGAADVSVTMLAGHIPQPGQFFGADPGTLYLISHVYADPDVANRWLLTFQPVLRAAIGQSDTLNFDTPTCEMRQAKDDSGTLDFSAGFAATQKLEFTEAI